ncbi:MAG: DUF2628 domain-containing protein [Candidatus Omnitrophota bacterium]
MGTVNVSFYGLRAKKEDAQVKALLAEVNQWTPVQVDEFLAKSEIGFLRNKKNEEAVELIQRFHSVGIVGGIDGLDNPGYYSKQFTRFYENEGRFRITWNWASAIFTWLWLLFRSLWAKWILYSLIATAGSSLLLYGATMLGNMTIIIFSRIIIWVGALCFFGLVGNYDYFLKKTRNENLWPQFPFQKYKLQYWLAVLFLFFFTILFFVLSRQQEKNRSGETFSTVRAQVVLQNAKPLAWLNDQQMLVGLDSKIVRYDIRGLKIVDVISDSYFSGADECFSPEGGVFRVNQPIVAAESGIREASSEWATYHWIQDWNAPKSFEKLNAYYWWKTNLYDCKQFDFNQGDPSRVIGGEVWNFDRDTPQLLRTTEGKTQSYLRYENRHSRYEAKHERKVFVADNGKVREIDLGEKSGDPCGGLRASLDRTTNEYFWYEACRNFNSSEKRWPLDGWWIAPDGQVNKVVIPKGPWIKHYSLLSQLKYFSCGLTCYCDMEMYVGNKQIYIYISGKAVDSSAWGVYRLDVKNQAWRKMIAGATDNGLFISPNGCQISYAVNGEMKIMDVCGK